MRSKREVLFTVLVVGFVWVSLFGHWLPIRIQSLLFLSVLFLGFAMIVAGWWGWTKSRKADDVPQWRKRVGLLGVIANTAALAIPFGSLVYMMYYPFLRFGVRLPTVNAQWEVTTVLALSVSGLISGIFSPPRSRLATALGGLIIGSMMLSIPIGIL